MSKLAVVIPAYKATYFDKALKSLANQTVKDFSVYVGDDCSPEDLKRICDRYADRLDIAYTRFPDNIGSKNLVHQWNRCIGLTKGEEWLWLFSDDDLIAPNCVAQFFETVKKKDAYEVYRFNTTVIDKDDNVLMHAPQGPEVEGSAQMAYHLLLAERGNSMPDHIFSRNVYEKSGGFVFTNYAQAADWASSILFSKDKGICIIPEARLFWRMSGINISSAAGQKRTEMLKGHLQFIDWLIAHFQYLKKDQSSRITFEMMKEAATLNLRSVIVNHYKGLDGKNTRTVFRFLRRRLNLSSVQAFKEILLIKKRSSPLLSKFFFQIRRMVPAEKLETTSKP